METIQGIWITDSLGSSKRQIYSGNAGQPNWSTNSDISFLRGVTNSSGVVIGDSLLSSSIINSSTKALFFIKGGATNQKYSQDKMFIVLSLNSGLSVVNTDGTNFKELISIPSPSFSISPRAQIVYVNFDYSRIDNEKGTLWVIGKDGSNLKQLTFNNYTTTN